MRLRRPCEHDRYDEHFVAIPDTQWSRPEGDCPGGEFLPEDALVVDPNNVEEVAEALVVLDALMESFDDPGGVSNGL